MNSAAQHCLDLVRAGDKDRFLSSLFAPEARRPHLLALYAFNLEITRVRELVSEPRLGDIRHQWWLDTLDGIYAGEVAAHPVAEQMTTAIAAGGLPKHALRNLVLARQFDLYQDPMPSLASLEGYLGETSSTLIQMAALMLSGQSTADAAGLGGVAYGLARVLCSGRARAYLPADMVQEHGEVDTLTRLIQHARARLAEARTHVVPAAVRPAFLPVSLTDLYLDRLERRGSDALSRPLGVSQVRRQWRLWRVAASEKF